MFLVMLFLQEIKCLHIGEVCYCLSFQTKSDYFGQRSKSLKIVVQSYETYFFQPCWVYFQCQYQQPLSKSRENAIKSPWKIKNEPPCGTLRSPRSRTHKLLHHICIPLADFSLCMGLSLS